jgi:predicted transcriptional regulator
LKKKINSDEIKFTPTEEDLKQIEEVLRKINEEKFKSLEVDNTNQVSNELNDEVEEVVHELPTEEIIQETNEESNDVVTVEEQETTIIEEVVKEEEIKTEEVVLENSEPIIEEVTELPEEEPVVTPEQRAINRLSYTKRNANNVSVQRI